jgi:hypothetical protein
MLNIGQLAHTVQKNCHISDAKHAGDYTMCVFLLKMREFYRWENEIPFSGALPNKEIGEWLQQRERMWEHLESSNFEPLPLECGSVDPFATTHINKELVPQGFIYSGGYGRFCKPHFFLADLISKEERNGFTIYISSCEYARDLAAPPAMLLGKTIYLRQESVRRYTWEKIEEWRWSRKNDAMARALAYYEFDSDAETALEQMTQNESETMILHELGEGMAGKILDDDWNTMLAGLSRSKAEIMARAVRDLLADCLSTLPGLMESENHAALHSYFANFSGMRKHLFPEALKAYRQWVEDMNLNRLRRLTEEGKERWQETACAMLDLYSKKGGKAGTAIEALLDQKSV